MADFLFSMLLHHCYRGCIAGCGNLINILKQSLEIVRCPMAWLGRIVGTQTQLYRNTLETRSLLPLDLFTASFKPSWALRPCDARIQHAHTHTLDGCVCVGGIPSASQSRRIGTKIYPQQSWFLVTEKLYILSCLVEKKDAQDKLYFHPNNSFPFVCVIGGISVWSRSS